SGIVGPSENKDSASRRIFIIRQTKHDVKAISKESPISFSLYWDPGFDSQVAFSAQRGLTLQTLCSGNGVCNHSTPVHVLGNSGISLAPGMWCTEHVGKHIVDLWILEKPGYVTMSLSQENEQWEQSQCNQKDLDFGAKAVGGVRLADELHLAQAQSSKRTISSQNDLESVSHKRQRTCNMFRDVVTSSTADETSPLETSLVIRGRKSLYDLPNGESIEVDSQHSDRYTIPRTGNFLYKTSNSRIFTAKIVDVILTKNRDHEYRKRLRSLAESYVHEISIQRSLSHKSLVSLIDGDARFFSLYLQSVMAHNLADTNRWCYSNTKGFAGQLEDILGILRQSASALAYLRSKSIVHHDIKPRSILFSRQTDLELCDFEFLRNALGAYWYIPPESVKERGFAGDIWAFGITLLYLIKKTPLPESLAESVPSWNIRSVCEHDPENTDNHIWGIVSSFQPCRLDWCLRKMLMEDAVKRISAKDLAIMTGTRSI
ncbi:hypothetical protein TD95_003590, partial [Thielaviopsis punctulata]